MPAKRCQKNKRKGWKWGDRGFCYVGGEEAKSKAKKQGQAIKASGGK